jgi:hypothetical protein
MKKVFFSFALAFVCFITKAQTLNLYNYQNDLQALVANISNVNSTLSFASNEQLTNTIDRLDEICNLWNDTYVANFPNDIDPEVLDSLDEVNNFNEDQPLIDLENMLKFSSLRMKVAKEEEDWLEQSGENIDSDNDPTDSYETIDDNLQSLLNSNGVLIVAGQIVNMEPQFDNGSIAAKDQCTGSKRKSKWFSLPGTKRKFKCIASFQGYFAWGGSIDAKTKSYKLKKKRYYKSRYNIYASVDGSSKIRPTDGCSKSFPVNLVEKQGFKKKVKAKFRIWGTKMKIIPTDGVSYDIITFHNRLSLNPWTIKL